MRIKIYLRIARMRNKIYKENDDNVMKIKLIRNVRK